MQEYAYIIKINTKKSAAPYFRYFECGMCCKITTSCISVFHVYKQDILKKLIYTAYQSAHIFVNIEDIRAILTIGLLYEEES